MLTWDAVAGAASYHVYRKTANSYEKIGTTANLTYTDAGRVDFAEAEKSMLQPYLRTERKESIPKSSASNVRSDGSTTRMKELNITEIGVHDPMASITEDRYTLWKR